MMTTIAAASDGASQTRGEEEAAVIKCVVWDLDNTLWQGTLLEGGPLVLTPGVGEVVRELDRRGILQSIASKNDFPAAWSRLELLALDEYFLHPHIDWVSKSDSLKAIAEALGLGLDALALIDDDPFERDEVRFHLPQVTTIDAARIGELLTLPGLSPRFVTGESSRRRHMYQADIRRMQDQTQFAGPREGFLATLDMVLTVRPAVEQDLQRAEELTIRTNQLNTTGRTYSYAELQALLHSRDHLLLIAELEDRYGSSGAIGLALIEMETEGWLVKLLLMSCRVLSRGVGGAMLTFILRIAKGRGVRLWAEFISNDRNRIMYVTYRFAGFSEVGQHDGVAVLEHDLKRIRPFPPYLTVREPCDTSEGRRG